MMTELKPQKQRTEKQKQNDIACSLRMKLYHEELKRLKELKQQEETKEETRKGKKPKKARAKKEKAIEMNSITPLKNNPDEFEVEI